MPLPTMTDGAEVSVGDAPGSMLDGRYLLRAEIGRGAMGTVWEAFDQHTSAVVAVKVVHPRFLRSPAARKRFSREVESASALRHPHTVRVLAQGQTPAGGGYLVMERLFGGTLGSRLRAVGALPQLRAIKIAAQILDGAGAAHRLHIVHRDLKPGNVVLVDRAEDPDFVKVCDFGLAKAIDVDGGPASRPGIDDAPSRPTSIGEICGTPEYMAPEQAKGEAIDGRADLYAVAVMLFEAVTGILPFSGRTPLAVISQHLSASPPRLRDVRPELEIFPPLEGLVLRALAKDRAERPSSADVFRADLLQIGRDLAHWQQRKGTGRGAATSDAKTLPGHWPGGHLRARSVRRWAAFGVPSLIAVSTLAFVVGSRGRDAMRDGLTPSSSSATPAAAKPKELRGPLSVGTAGPSLIPREPLPAGRQPSPLPAPAPAVTKQLAPRVPFNRPSAARARGWHRAPTEAHTRSPVASAPMEASMEPAPRADPRADEHASLENAQDLLGQGRIAEACDVGQAAASLTPASAPAWEFLGRCRMRLGQPGQARAAYRRYLELVPDGPNTVFVRAMLERQAK